MTSPTDRWRPRLVQRGRSLGVILSLGLLAACSTTMDASYSTEAVEKTTVYLVRHAEKADGSRDPDLNETGRARAALLATVLANAKVDSLWSTDYKRTRETLAPLATALNLGVNLYDARDSEGLVRTIMDNHHGSTLVVAGHSNTVPALADLFEGWPSTVIGDQPRPNLGHAEYGTLFVVTLVKGQPAVVEIRKY